jgi:hypothetical protein
MGQDQILSSDRTRQVRNLSYYGDHMVTTTWIANSRFGLLFFVVMLGALVALFAKSLGSEEPQKSGIGAKPLTQASTIPQYTDKGELKLPADFETWVFVGANMGLEYREAAAKEAPPEKESGKHVKIGNFHNVYINPEAYTHYAKTGTFPEPTILVLDIFQAEQGEPNSIVSEGLFPGEHKDIAVAVKNSARPDGAKTDWAYYDFPKGQTTAKAFPNKACYDCHLEHADDDNVWSQFYPTLRKHRQGKEKR